MKFTHMWEKPVKAVLENDRKKAHPLKDELSSFLLTEMNCSSHQDFVHMICIPKFKCSWNKSRKNLFLSGFPFTTNR